MYESKNLENIDASYQNFPIFHEVFICSNRLINTNNIFQSQKGWAPLAIRRSRSNEPLIWLSAQVPSENENENESKYIELIRKNSVVFDQNRIELQVSSYGFCISLDSTVICEAGDLSESSIEIFKLDFRPLGLNIYGDHTILNIGNNKMSRNTSSNSQAMFGI